MPRLVLAGRGAQGDEQVQGLFGEEGQPQVAWPAVDDSDDYWQIDAFNGFVSARKERVAFTCVRPKGVPQPAPVMMFGHGYGSNRLEFLTFAWVVTRMGSAACALDYPGHGVALDADEDLTPGSYEMGDLAVAPVIRPDTAAAL